MTVHNVAIALPDPWIVIDAADLATDRLVALPDDAAAVRGLLEQAAMQLAERQVGFVALRILATEDGPVPTGLITLTLDESDAADLAEVERRVEEELADVQVRRLGEEDYVIGVSSEADERTFIRGDFRLVGDDVLLTVWSTIAVLDDAAIEHDMLDAIIGNLRLIVTDETESSPASS